MPDVEWIIENCHMMQDNGYWAGEKQISMLAQMVNTHIT